MRSVGHHIHKTNQIYIASETCEGCGKEVEIYDVEIMGGPQKGEYVRAHYGCKCRDRELARKVVQDRKRKEGLKLMQHFDRFSLINPDLLCKGMDDYKPENETEAAAKRAALDFVNKFDGQKPMNLSFHGNFGIGKSHLAKAIADEIIKKGFSAIFISLPKLLRKVRGSYNNNSAMSEDEIFNALEKVDLLVLDDLGAEKNTDWAQERVFDLLDSRQGKCTVFTTNFKPEHLLQMYGERDYSRFKLNTSEFEFSGRNRRL